MILAIDIGNTNIVIGCIRDTGIAFKELIYTDEKKTAVEYAITIKNILGLNGIDMDDIKGGIMSSSVPPVTTVVRQALEKMLKKKVFVVGPGVKTGLDIKIDNPAELGPDLAVGAAAGIAGYGAPLIIIDMGTATTITVVNEKKQVIGGMIMPGIGVSLEGMSLRTSHLPKISVEPPKKLIGSNTIECMQSGILYGNAACMDGVVQRIREQLGCEAPVVATGGMAKKVIPLCREKMAIDDELLLKGLKLIYDKNHR
ncbi:MAG: type III pantothenate kinase [Eubacteriales bacterium]|nr:type III pantothenate kinase [Eubacteriales bacterium]